MEMKNAFKGIVSTTEKGKWYDLHTFLLITGYQMKLSGIDWRTIQEISSILQIMKDIGFIELNQVSTPKVKIQDYLYEAADVAV